MADTIFTFITPVSKGYGVQKRLDQLLSNCGYCSRSEAKKLARQSRIKVNGEVVRNPAIKAEASTVLLDDEPLDHPEGILVMLNKPAGYVCRRVFQLMSAFS